MRMEPAVGGGSRHREMVRVSLTALLVLSAIVLFALTDQPGVTTKAVRILSTGPNRLSPSFDPSQPAPRPATAEVRITAPVRPTSVARGFFGLSTEYWALPVYERHISLLNRVLSLVRVRGNGPQVLRIGGDSANSTFWAPRVTGRPRWVFGLNTAWLRRTSVLVRRAGLGLILDLNLITGSPSSAARWARAAENGLPRGSIVGLEIGNEPDGYGRRNLLATVSGTRLPAKFLGKQLSSDGYAEAFRSYATALAPVAPNVPLAGPALENPVRNLGWISTLVAGPHRALGIVTAHQYLFSACARRRSPSYPTIARLLSEHATAAMAHRIRAAVRVAHRAGLRFRLTELNSVSCGGVRGVSDAFATALWAPNALFELLGAGVDGVDLHVRTNAVNAAFTLTRRGLGAAPLLYGLILFAQTLSSDPQLVHLQLHANGSLGLKAWAARVSGGVLHVLLINDGNQSVRVGLQIPATGPVTVERLLAPSAKSSSGITLAGRHLGRDGRWHGRLAIQRIAGGVHGYQLLVPRTSAALASVRLGPGAGAP